MTSVKHNFYYSAASQHIHVEFDVDVWYEQWTPKERVHRT